MITLVGAGVLALAIAATGGVPKLEFEFRGSLTDVSIEKGRDGESAVAVSFALPPGRPASHADVFEEAGRDSPRWTWISSTPIESAEFSAAGRPGRRVLIVVRSSAFAGYLLDGPFIWPAGPVNRAVSDRAVHTVRGTFSPGKGGATVRLAGRSAGDEGLCENLGPGRWQCIAVPAQEPVLLEACFPDGSSGYTDPPDDGREVRIRPLRWSAVAHMADSAQQPPASVEVGLWKPGPAGGTILVPANGLEVRRLGSDIWLGAPADPEGAVVRFHSQNGRVGSLALNDLLHSGSCGASVDVLLRQPERIWGVVYDAAHQPLKSAVLLAFQSRSAGGAAGPARVVADAESDEQGRFAFKDLEPGTYLVRVCHGSAGCLEQKLATYEDPTELILSPRWALQGRAVSATGVPEPRASIRLLPTLDQYQAAADRTQFLPVEVVAGDDGRFSIGVSLKGAYLVEARGSRSGLGRRRVDVTDFSPTRSELGDIRIANSQEFSAVLRECPGGSLVFSGPVGGETSLPSLLEFDLGSGGRAAVSLPEGGSWIVWAKCGGQSKALEPTMLPDVSQASGMEIVFAFDRAKNDPPR